MSGQVIYNSKNLKTYGFRIGGVSSYQAAAPEGYLSQVPGRLGAALAVGAFVEIPNEIREYDAALYLRASSNEDVSVQMAKIRHDLMLTDAYRYLTDSYEPLFYRRAIWYGDFAPVRKGAGQNFAVTLRFSCDPRRFLLNAPTIEMEAAGDLSVTVTPYVPQNLYAVGNARPLITVYGNNTAFDLIFLDNGTEYGRIKFAAFNGQVTFDADSMMAFANDLGQTPLNNRVLDVTGDIYLFGLRNTTVTRTNTSADILINPRWWVR